MKSIRLSSETRKQIPFFVLLLVLLFAMPRTAKFGYEYKKGSVWSYESLVAQFDFPVLKPSDQIREEAEKSLSSAVPYYKYSDEVVNRALKSLQGMDFGKSSSMKSAVVGSMRSIMNREIVSDDGVKVDRRNDDPSNQVLIVQKHKKAVKMPVSEVLKLSDAKARLLSEVSRSFPGANVDSVLRSYSVYDLIVPNISYDRQTTELAQSESIKSISPTVGFVNKGQLIVAEGEVITAEVALKLDSYKEEFEKSMGSNGPGILTWLGNLLLALCLVLLLYGTVFSVNPALFAEMNKIWYIVFIIAIGAASSMLVGKASPYYHFMLPMPALAMWLIPFFRNRIVITVYVVALLPLLIFAPSGVVLFTIFLCSGVFLILAFRHFPKVWLHFVMALAAFLIMLLIYIAFRIIDMEHGPLAVSVLFMLVSSCLSVILSPLTLLFERLFNLMSDSRLRDLSDTSNTLLRELELKAPGTYQHSLQVMSMADAAARSIGANVLQVRAGALYHDIGKMNNPLCFIENENLLPEDKRHQYHAGLTPEQSAGEIIRHVNDGVRIGKLHKLPQLIIDFILTHHGDSRTAYFFSRYLEQGGDESDDAAFRYQGFKPRTREQVIIMLCDSVEAASRTLDTTAPDAFSVFVERLVSAKVAEHQIDEANISIKDLNTVKESLKSYLAQLYHERVAYPGR